MKEKKEREGNLFLGIGLWQLNVFMVVLSLIFFVTSKNKTVDVDSNLPTFYFYSLKDCVVVGDAAEVSVEKPKPTEEQIEIREEGSRSLVTMLGFEDSEPIVLDRQSFAQIKNYWKDRYGKGRLRRSLQQAYFEMGAWEPRLKMIFREVFADVEFPDGLKAEDLIYLAIPESHWRLDAVSSAGAVGPYQFMPETARKYRLNSACFVGEHKYLDERMDPLKSARATAESLRDIYKRTGDIYLAISGHNGGFIWSFIRTASRDQINYDNFLKYMENLINKERDWWQQKKKGGLYIVKRNDSVYRIAKKHGVPVAEFYRVNNLDDNSIIHPGQKLIVPGKSVDEEAEAGYYKKIAGYSENLNYPQIFLAVLELIKEGVVTEKRPEIEFDMVTVRPAAYRIHVVRAGQNPYRIGLWHGVDLDDIVKFNPGLDIYRVPVGFELRIPVEGGQYESLEAIARQTKTPLERLTFLNPAIKNPEKPLPPGYQVRV